MPAKKTTTKKSPKKSTRTSTAKKKASNSKAKPAKAGDKEVTIDRRSESEENAGPPASTEERRKKVQRRRQIDPTTCERDYSTDEVEFMNAMDEYKRTSGRMFPTCSEVLEVIRELGYVRLSPSELAIRNAESTEEPVAVGAEVSDGENEFDSSFDSDEMTNDGWTI